MRKLALFAALALCLLLPRLAHAAYGPGFNCTNAVAYSASTSGATQLVAAISNQQIFVCGYVFLASSVATSVGLEYGTGANCSTGTAAAGMPPQFVLPAGIPLVDHTNAWSGIVTPASKALCLVTGAGNPVQAIVYFSQQ